MLGSHFYNKSIRKYVAVIGTLFNGMTYKRPNRPDEIKVPISYQSKEKFMAYNLNVKSDTEFGVDVQTILPRMSYYMNGVRYDSSRKVNTLNRSVTKHDVNGVSVNRGQLAEVPYIFTFDVGIYTRYEDDALQLVEQILPYFQPKFTTKIREYTQGGVVDRDIYIVLTNVNIEEEFEGMMDEGRRIIQWSLTFDLYGFLYPNIQSATLIKQTIVDFVGREKDILGSEDFLLRIDASVDPLEANKEDPHTIVVKVDYNE